MIKKWTKRMLAAILAGSMIFGLAGCGQDVPEAESTTTEEPAAEETAVSEEAALAEYVNMDSHFPICEEPITITVSGGAINSQDWNSTDVVKYIADEMGIAMECEPFSRDEVWPTQFTLMLSSDELPDLLVGANTAIGDINEHGQEGYFLALNDYLDYMPNFKEYLDKNPNYKAVITAPDGNIYGLTASNENVIARVIRTFINQTWLNNVGKEVPTTIDELYDVLKAFKEQDANGNGDPNDEIPLSGGAGDLLALWHSFGIYSNTAHCSVYADETGKVTLGQVTDNYKDMLKFIKKLYDEGLYDKDGLVQNGDELKAKYKADQIGMCVVAAPYAAAGTDISYDANWAWLDGMTSEYSDEGVVVYNAAVDSTVKMAVNANTEYPEAICRLIDYFYTDEGSIVASRGIDGIGREWFDVEFLDGVQYVDAVNPDPDNYASAEAYRGSKSLINEGMNVRKFFYGSMYQIMTSLSDEDLAKEELLLNQGWGCLVERGRRELTSVDDYPTLVYTDEESGRRSTLKTDISMYAQQAFGQFVIGDLDIEKDWENYVATIEELGLTELLEIEQAAYDRTK